MVRAGHGRGMASVNNTQSQCVNQMGKTHSKPLASRHGRGTAWARHAMCESAFTGRNSGLVTKINNCWTEFCVCAYSHEHVPDSMRMSVMKNRTYSVCTA
jgi:hypothetical protein